MRIKNFGGTRNVPGVGLVEANIEIEVSDEIGAKLDRIPGFRSVQPKGEPDGAPTTGHVCDECGNEYGSKSSLNRHMKTHEEDE